MSRAGRASLAILLPAIGFLSFSAADAQTLGHGADDGISSWRVLFALILCLGLAVAAALLLKARIEGRLSGKQWLFSRTVVRNRRLELIETLRINQQIDLCIIACDGRELLIVADNQGIRILDHLAQADSASTEDRS